MSRDLAWTYVIQGAGAALGLLTVVLLGSTLGPGPQGTFNRTKTELEFLTSVGALGLPQAFIFYVQTGRLTARRATRISLLAALLGTLLVVVYSAVRAEVSSPVAFACAATAMLWHGNVRAVVLSTAGGKLFNLVTALPQALVFAIVLPLALLSRISDSTAALAFAAAFAASGAVGYVVARRHPRSDQATDDVRVGRLMAYGSATWISAIGQNATILLCTLWVSDHLGGRSLGVFTAAMVLSQILLMPINYASPILFRHWVARQVTSRLAAHIALTAATPVVLAVVLGLVAAAGWRLPLLGDYVGLTEIVWLVFAGVAIETVVKLLAVACLSRGMPVLLMSADILRAVFAFTAVQLLPPDASLLTVTAVWAGASAVACVVLTISSWRVGLRANDPSAQNAALAESSLGSK